MSRKRKTKRKNGCVIMLRGKRVVWLNPAFIFELYATHGLPIEAAGERMNELGAITDWREVARLCVEHEDRSKANSKFSREIFASSTTEDTE